MTGTLVEVTDVEPPDLGPIASLHVAAFPDSVLGRLGVEAVRRSYQWQLDGPHDLTALSARVDGDVVGFLFGGVFRGATIGFVKRERWFLLGRVVRRPGVVLREVGRDRVVLAVRLLLRRGAAAVPEDPDAVPRRSFGVLAIAVDPSAQGRGVGGRLMAEAAERARIAGFETMHLTVHPSNRNAVEFYRSLGWKESEEPDGSWVGRMIFPLHPAP